MTSMKDNWSVRTYRTRLVVVLAATFGIGMQLEHEYLLYVYKS